MSASGACRRPGGDTALSGLPPAQATGHYATPRPHRPAGTASTERTTVTQGPGAWRLSVAQMMDRRENEALERLVAWSCARRVHRMTGRGEA